jgi:hypothetical protein
MSANAAQTDAQAQARPLDALNHAAVDWAWAQSIANNAGARIVLMCLARRVDDMWECTTSQEEVAMDAMLSVRSIRRHLEQLEGDGFIARQRRFDDKGHRLADRLRLNPGESLPANLSGRAIAKGADWPVAKLAAGSDQQRSLQDRLAGGQVDLWPDWPVGGPDETDIPRSRPAAKLTSGQIGRAISSSPTENYEKNTSSSPERRSKPRRLADAPPREDVEHLCGRLLKWMQHNQVRKTPDAVSEAWRREARLLLDKDKVPFAEATQVLDWCQRDGFWSQNIHSMPTFREKYGQLEMKSRGARGDTQVRQLRPTGTGGHQPYQNPTDPSVYHEDL